MRDALIGGFVALALLFPASHASAQTIEGFLTGGVHRDVNRQQFVGAGGGLLLTPVSWLSLGAQGDAFFSLPYVAGRGTFLVQGNLFEVNGMRPFVQVGASVGELKGPMYGAGVDVRPRNARVGLRASVQAYQAGTGPGQKRTVQPSVNVGVIWRR